MYKEFNRGSRDKLPSNTLCVRAFSRSLKHQLLGYVGSSPEYDAVADAYENKTMCALSNATWSRWWNGECMPDSKAKTVIEREIPGLVNNWLKFDVNNRLQRAHSQKVGKTYCKVAT